MKTLPMVAALLAAIACTPACASPAGMSEADEAIARMQITDVLNRYALAHNTDDVDGYVALFTEDGQFGQAKGKAAIAEMARKGAVTLHRSHV